EADFDQVQKTVDAKREAANKIKDVKKRNEALRAIYKEEDELRAPLLRRWAPEGEEFLSKMRALHTSASGLPQQGAKENMAEMRKTYNDKYEAWNALYNGESKSFDQVVLGDTRVGGALGWELGANKKTRALLAGSGYLSDEDKLYYSVKGAGTDEKTAKQ